MCAEQGLLTQRLHRLLSNLIPEESRHHGVQDIAELEMWTGEEQGSSTQRKAIRNSFETLHRPKAAGSPLAEGHSSPDPALCACV